MVRCAPRGSHIAYEPIPEHAETLRVEFPNVDVRQAALSDHEGETMFTHVLSEPGYSGFKLRPLPRQMELATITVRTARLDDDLPAGFVPTLIKIDVEGAEEQVIVGAMQTLRRHRPTVVFEHGRGSAAVYGTTPERIHQLLCEDAGLRIFDLDGAGPYGCEEFKSTPYFNFVAHP
jgi:FkbM family methyltransferase